MVSEISRTGVIEKEGQIYAPYIPVTEGTITVLVDTFSYDEAFGTHQRIRCNDYTKNYEPMRLTPQQIKEFIDKGINLKIE